MRRFSLGIVLTLLLMSMLTLAFNIQLVETSGTIYIRADGSVDPPTAPISTTDNITYTFTNNIYDNIVVERDNIVVDGAGYTLQGTGSGFGIDLTGRSNVTIKNAEIKMFDHGIWLDGSSNNTVSGNNITNNEFGILLQFESDHNSIYLNNFIDNTYSYYIYNSINIWNSPSLVTYVYAGSFYTNFLGNYWSDYGGSDADGDGIGDTPYSIDSDKDDYPLMEKFENYLEVLDLSTFPSPFVFGGVVNSTVVIGTSDPHGPCGSAHTLDTVGGMGVTAVLGTCGSVADCRFYLDTDIAWYNETEYKVHYWPVEGLTNIITTAGPGVNMITWRYFCNPWYAPVYMYYDGGLGEWVVATPTATYRSSDWIGAAPLSDLVVLEVIHVPEEGRYVLWVGGFGGYATRAGCLALQLFDT